MARSSTTTSRPSRRRARLPLPKPTGLLDQRVQAVGPEHFGIVSVDCAKQRSRWMLCDFYGRVLLQPASVEHSGPELRRMVALLRHAAVQHQLGHVLIAIERTGNYHRPVQRACRDAGFETRIVHPFASHHFREIEHPENKTDDNDLEGIHRAAVVGFGLVELPLDETCQRLRLLVRHRRDFVRKTAAVQCQIKVDRRGRMVRSANRRLRAALLQIADNLLTVNNHYRGQAALWRPHNIDRRLQRVRVAKRFTRLAYAMLAGRQIIPHPCCREPHYILDKLLAFLLEHGATHAQVRDCLDAAAQQLPQGIRTGEGKTLQCRADEFQTARKVDVRSLGSILKEVLANRLQLNVQSSAEG